MLAASSVQLRRMALEHELDELASRYGIESVLAESGRLASRVGRETLTIIANDAIHTLPTSLRRGLVVSATSGTLDFTSADAVRREHVAVVTTLTPILQSKPWGCVYLAPFGPPTISMQIKLLVYRVLRLETIDLLYAGDRGFFEVRLDQRSVIVGA